MKLERTTIGVNQYYGLGYYIYGLGYYIYHTKKGEVPNNPPQQPLGGAIGPPHPHAIATQPPSGVQPAQTNKFGMD